MMRTVPPSFRRKPESSLSERGLDSGVRRDDGAFNAPPAGKQVSDKDR
jgi:hypothetical protein